MTIHCSFDLFASTEKLIQWAYVLACPAPMTDGSASYEILSQALSTLRNERKKNAASLYLFVYLFIAKYDTKQDRRGEKTSEGRRPSQPEETRD